MGYLFIIILVFIIIGASSNSNNEQNSKTNKDNVVFYNGKRTSKKILNTEKVKVSNSVTSIGKKTFYKCNNLQEIEIPNSVTSIGESAFYKCSTLKEIQIPNSVTSIGESAFYKCNSLKEIEIPNSVTSIGKFAFSHCSNLKEIEIPNSVTSIRESAFSHCRNLKEIEIPNSVTSIENYAFYECRSLEKIKIPNSVTAIGKFAFKGCSNLKEIEIPNSISSIENFTFNECSNLEKIEIPNSVTSIKGSAFSYCSKLKEIEIPNSVTSIGESAFYECRSLEKIEIPNSVTSIKGSAFSYCSRLKEIEIPNSVTSIGESAFYKCSNLKEIEIPNSVTSIGESAFGNCRNLEEIEIPNSVTSIGNYAFRNCRNLKCNKGSYAEKYLKENNIHFRYITDINSQNIQEDLTESINDNNYKKEEFENKIEFLSAQAVNIIKEITNAAYQDFEKTDRTDFHFSMRIEIFNKKLNRVNGDKKLYSDSLKLNILYFFNLIEDINDYITSCIKSNRFPTSYSEWQSILTQLENKNKITDINKAKNKEKLNVYKNHEITDKFISDLEWNYTFFYINSWILKNCINVLSENNDFAKPLLKESPNAIIKEFEKSCDFKTNIFLNNFKKIIPENKPKTFKEFYSSKTAEQLKNDVDEMYYSKLNKLNLKDASFGTNGSKEFLGAIELALFETKLKSDIEKGIENVFTRDWGGLDFSEYMDEIVEKYSSITINEWNESYRYFEKNHSWLDQHPCASPEVAMKRFEFLRERN